MSLAFYPLSLAPSPFPLIHLFTLISSLFFVDVFCVFCLFVCVALVWRGCLTIYTRHKLFACCLVFFSFHSPHMPLIGGTSAYKFVGTGFRSGLVHSFGSSLSLALPILYRSISVQWVCPLPFPPPNCILLKAMCVCVWVGRELGEYETRAGLLIQPWHTCLCFSVNSLCLYCVLSMGWCVFVLLECLTPPHCPLHTKCFKMCSMLNNKPVREGCGAR